MADIASRGDIRFLDEWFLNRVIIPFLICFLMRFVSGLPEREEVPERIVRLQP